MPLISALGNVDSFCWWILHVVLKDPDFAQKMGLISTKAQFVGVGLAIIFKPYIPSYCHRWPYCVWVCNKLVFGREYSDRTIKDLLLQLGV